MGYLKSVKLTEIPTMLLSAISSNRNATVWLNGMKVERIIIYRDMQYRILTNKGEYRYPLNTDLELEIQPL